MKTYSISILSVWSAIAFLASGLNATETSSSPLSEQSELAESPLARQQQKFQLKHCRARAVANFAQQLITTRALKENEVLLAKTFIEVNAAQNFIVVSGPQSHVQLVEELVGLFDRHSLMGLSLLGH